MKSIDDIDGFKEKTGLGNYKTLSQYNIEHLTKSWPVLNMINKPDDKSLTIKKPSGVADFYISDKEAASKTNITSSAAVNVITTEQTAVITKKEMPVVQNVTLAEESRPKMPVDEYLSEKENTHPAKEDLKKFSGLFSPDAKSAPHLEASQTQRSTPLAQIFGRNTSSCQ